MSRTKSLCLFAGAALSLSGAALAQSTTGNLDASRAYAGDLLADANSRTSQLAQTAGKFTVDVHGYMQFRYDFNHNDDNTVDKDNTQGFQNARTRLNVSGNLFNEDWYYFIQFGWGPDGETILEDAYGSYKFGNGWEVMWGQFKAPFMREELISDKFLLAADRSQMWNTFTVGRTQGLQLGFEGQQARVMLSFNDGATNSNSGFLSAQNSDFVSPGEADYAFTGRVEFKWAGDWKQALDFTSFQQSPFFGMVGGAVHWQSGGDSFASPYPLGTTANVDIFGFTGDVSLEGDGWNAFAAATYTHVDPDGGTSTNNWGFLVQGGVFVSPKWELFGRWDSIFPDSDFSPNDDNFNTITLGANDYIMQDSHAAKFTVDFQWFLNNPASSSIVNPNTLTGLLTTNSDNEWNIRAQMQLVF